MPKLNLAYISRELLRSKYSFVWGKTLTDRFFKTSPGGCNVQAELKTTILGFSLVFVKSFGLFLVLITLRYWLYYIGRCLQENPIN
jgi:hypothetical protein